MTTLDQIAGQLREWRIAAGSPSYAELARRVGELRAASGQEARHAAPGRVTVYDCFRDGRSRIDVHLAVDLAAALDITVPELDEWRVRCTDAMRPTAARSMVTASRDLPAPAEPRIECAFETPIGDRVLFAGIGGSGKTQAALRLLDSLRRSGGVDRVLTVRIDGPDAGATEVLHAAAHELSLRLPPDPAAAAGRLIAVLERRRTALFVDDVATVDQISVLAGARSGVPLVATSRQALAVPGLPRVDVPPWGVDEVAAYLTQVIGAERTAPEPEALAGLVELVGGLPLIAALVAARVRDTPTWSLADHVAALRERRAGDRVEDAVRASMDMTRSGLTETARILWTTLASGPRAGLTTPTLLASVDIEVDAALLELERAYLLHPDDRRHQLHDVPRVYARDRAAETEPPSVRDERAGRLLDRLCAEAWGVARALAPSDAEATRFERDAARVDDPHAWLTSDLAGALELAVSARQRRPETLVELSEAVSTSLERSGLTELATQLHTAAWEAAVTVADPVGEARARCALAIAAMRRGESDAPLDEITALATRVGDTWTLARLGNLRGILAMRNGDDEEGMRLFHEAHDLAQSSGHRALAPAIAGNIAIGLAYAGDLDGALRWNQETLHGALAVDNHGLAATTLSTISDVQRMLGHFDDAVASARRAVQLAEQVGDHLSVVHAFLHLGASLTLSGHPAEAIDWLERAHLRASEIGLVEVESGVHTRIGEALLALGDRAGAEEHFRTAVDAPNDSPIDPATALHQWGRLAAARSVSEACELFDRALALLGDGFGQVADAIRADRDALPALDADVS